MTITKAIGVLFVAALLGAGLAYLLAMANLVGLFAQWRSLETPPEGATKIITDFQGDLWIETTTENVYHYSYADNCANNCWESSTIPTPNPNGFTVHCPPNSINPPPNTIAIQQVCAPWGPGYIRYIYALQGDRSVSMWEHRVSEDDSMAVMTLPCVGVILGLLGAIPVILALKEHYQTTRRKTSITDV